MQQFILGTVQLGMNYGINNRQGKPSIRGAFDILNIAYENNVKILDTALAYGDSEKVIGSFMRSTNKKFKIITKLPKLNKIKDMDKQVKKSLEMSINNLGVSKINYYLYHSFEDLILNPHLFKYIENLKGIGIIEKLGVSIYDVEELEYILDNLCCFIDIIQIPFNILDLRWLENDLFKKLKENKIEIAVRSVFLQGLFFADKYSLDKVHPKTFNYINKLNELAKNKKVTLPQIALSFVRCQKYIDYILIGCESSRQLIDNIYNFNKYVEYTKKDLDFINKNFKNIEKKIIDPRQW